MKNAFEASIDRIIERDGNTSPELVRRIRIEGRVVSKLVTLALASGWEVSVNDGEETVVKRSRDKAEIMAAFFSTDEDVISFHKPGAESRHGWVHLVYGNDGFDVMSNWGAPESEYEAFDAWMEAGPSAYADKLERGA